MNPIELALRLKDAIARGSTDMPLVMPGRWGKRDYKLFAGKGSPKGEIVQEREQGVVVMFNCQELLDWTIKRLADACREIGCSGVNPDSCPGSPLCDILRTLFRYAGSDDKK